MPDIASVPSTLPLSPSAPVDAAAPRPAADAARAATPAVSTSAPATPDALQRQLDQVLEQTDSSLRFRVDDEAKRVVVTVLDGRGEVIMQIPDKAALAVARHFARTGALLDASA